MCLFAVVMGKPEPSHWCQCMEQYLQEHISAGEREGRVVRNGVGENSNRGRWIRSGGEISSAGMLYPIPLPRPDPLTEINTDLRQLYS